jgi:Fe-S cluster biogenesis protein NfuA
LLQRLAADELTGSLLLLYDLHPDDFEVRLGKGIAEAEKAIAGQGATVDLTGVRDGVVHLRLTGKAHGCGSTQGGMEKAIQDAIFSAVPEVVAVRVENAVQSGPGEQLVQLQLAVAEPQRT